MNQGDVYLVNPDPTVETEIGKIRPGLIISVNAINHNSPRLIVAPITSSTGKVYPFEVSLPRGTAGLERDSKLMLDQLRSLDKKRTELPSRMRLRAGNPIAQPNKPVVCFPGPDSPQQL